MEEMSDNKIFRIGCGIFITGILAMDMGGDIVEDVGAILCFWNFFGFCFGRDCNNNETSETIYSRNNAYRTIKFSNCGRQSSNSVKY